MSRLEHGPDETPGLLVEDAPDLNPIGTCRFAKLRSESAVLAAYTAATRQLGNELLDIIDTIWAQTANADDQVRVVTRRLSPSTLRDEIFKLLANSRIDPSVVANDLPYRKLVTLLIADLLGKPISRSETARSKLSADHLAKGIRFVADRISFNQNEKLETELRLVSRQLDPPSDGEVHIVIPWLAAPKE